MINFSYYTNKDAPEWIKGRKEQEVREADKARNWAIGGAAGKSLIGLRELLKDMYDKKLYQLNDEGMPVWRKKDDVGFWDSIIPDKGEYEKIPYDVKETIQPTSNLAGAVSPEASGMLSYLMKKPGGLPETFSDIGKHGLPETFSDIGGKSVGEAGKASNALRLGGKAISTAGNVYGMGKGIYDMLNARNSGDTRRGALGTGSSALGLIGLLTGNPLLGVLGGLGSIGSMFA